MLFVITFLQPCPATVTSSSPSSRWFCRHFWGQIPTLGKNIECQCKILYWNDKIFTRMISGDFCMLVSTGVDMCTVIISWQPNRWGQMTWICQGQHSKMSTWHRREVWRQPLTMIGQLIREQSGTDWLTLSLSHTSVLLPVTAASNNAVIANT